MKKILALLLITLSFSGCEKDDICTDETTPRLILEFYDISNPANLKTVLNLKVKGVGQTDDLGTYNSVSKVELLFNIKLYLVVFCVISSGNSTLLTLL